jgi:hypothetical protein
VSYESQDSEGWCYSREAELHGDQRALVSLEDSHGMVWVGIRVWHEQGKRWFNGNDPEAARVIAWQPLKKPARRYWSRGQLIEERKP